MKVINAINKLPRKGGRIGRINLKSIKYVVVHHDAVVRPKGYNTLARYAAEARYHIKRGQGRNGIQYHYKIDNIGAIYLLQPVGDVLYHAANGPVNWSSIAICVDGYFHPPKNQKPTYEQFKSLKALVASIVGSSKYSVNWGRVKSHREISQTGTDLSASRS